MGSTDIKLSAIGLGLVKIGRNTGVKYPHSFQIPDDHTVRNLLETAFDLGVNLLDTAPAYGESETRLGKLRPHRREDWIICSKVGENFINQTSVSTFNFDRKFIIQSVEHSLRNIKTDYLDILLVHSNGEDLKIIEEYDVFKTLSELKQAGKIRYFGMSTKTPAGAKLAIEQSDLVMLAYNMNYPDEGYLIDYAASLGKGVLIKKGLESGHAGSFENAIEFIFKKSGVSSLIIGTLNIKHLKENIEALPLPIC